jgi:hypothetical protein
MGVYKMRIALLLGVSHYTNGNNLPACLNDIDIMHKLLDATEEFEEIKVIIADNKETQSVKNEIIDWVSSYNTGIEELFFYYTGHGGLHQKNFHYLLSDYDSNSYHQTSIENNYLDDIFRQINAKLTVKVIDACHSGTVYVKSLDVEIEKHFTESKGRFNNCIFMFSSASSQVSFQDSQTLSFFTKAFVDAVKNHSQPYIRYRDIQEFLSDTFPLTYGSAVQQPFYVIQTHYMEIFSQITDAITKLNYPSKTSMQGNNILGFSDENTSDESDGLSALELAIKNASKFYATEEQAMNLLQMAKLEIEKYTYSHDFSWLYKIDIQTVDSTQLLPMRESLGQWVVDNDTDEYFVKPTYRREYLNEGRYAALALGMGIERPYEKVLDGFDFTVNVPFKGIHIIARRKYQSVKQYGFWLTYLLGPQGLQVFYFYSTYKPQNWDSMTLNLKGKAWQVKAIDFDQTEKFLAEICNIMLEFDNYVVTEVKKQFNVD